MKKNTTETRKYGSDRNEEISNLLFPDELMESFNIALIDGGSIIIPHLRYAFEVMDEIFQKEESEK